MCWRQYKGIRADHCKGLVCCGCGGMCRADQVGSTSTNHNGEWMCILLINYLRLLSYTWAQCAVSMAEAGINMLLQQRHFLLLGLPTTTQESQETCMGLDLPITRKWQQRTTVVARSPSPSSSSPQPVVVAAILESERRTTNDARITNVDCSNQIESN